jgi:hypothetical protein
MAAVLPIRYVVSPNEQLLALLAEQTAANELREPIAFSQRQAYPEDHDYDGQTEDSETFAKLCWLAIFEKTRRTWEKHDAHAESLRLLSDVLGPPPRTLATFDRWWRLDRGKVFPAAKGVFDLDERVESLPVEALQTVEGPRSRSVRAEAAARELERQFLDTDPAHIYGEDWRERLGEVDWEGRARDDVARLIKPVGTWWDRTIAERLAPTDTD